MTVLPEYIDSRTMIVGHKREVQRGIVIKRIAPAETGDRMRKLAGIAQRLFCDDVNRTGNGRRTEQSRTTATHHLHPFDHTGRNLFQTVYSRQRTEYGTRVYQYLRIRTIQPINTNLLETTILAIGLYTYTGVEIQPL